MNATPTTPCRPGPEPRRLRRSRAPRRLLRLAAGLALVSAGLPSRGSAQGAPSGDAFDLAHPAVRAFSDRDGLPQNTVHAIARDAAGYLWVGTQDGAARWNGREWLTIDMPDREVSNYIRTLVAARDGTLWFGREAGGVVHLRLEPMVASPRPQDFTVFDTAQGLPASRVNRLLEASDGTIWAATSGGAARLVGARFEPLRDGLKDPRLWEIAEIEDDQGRRQIVAGGEDGLVALEGGRWSRVELGLGETIGSVNSLLQTKDSAGARTLWVGSYGGGVLRVHGGRVDRFGPAEGLASRLVTMLGLTRGSAREPQVWAATRDAGLFRLGRGDHFAAVPLGASVSEVYFLRGGGDDDPGALWVGTRTAGLLRLEAGSWLALDSASGLPTDQVLGLLETRDASGREVFWVGTANGLAVIRGATLAVEGAAQGLPGPQVLALAEFRDRDQPPQIWASVVGLGLVRRVGARWVRVDARPGFNADHGTWLLASRKPDGTGVLWVGTERSGLARFERGRWSVLRRRDGLPSDHVLALLETETAGSRTLWVGTRGGGVAQVVSGRVARTWSRGAGLPNDDALSLAEVRLPGDRRELWVGTRAGVARRDLDEAEASWKRLALAATAAGPAGTVFSIGQGSGGRIYLGTARGVVRLTPLRDTRDEEFVVERFGVADGLPSATANWRQIVDSKGRVWIATTGGIALLDPARETSFEASPAPLVIERAQATRSGLPIAPGATLPAGEHDVLFEFALLTPRRAGAVRYRTQLEGYDAEPSAWVAAYQKTYTNLPARAYVFRVEARDAGGRTSGPVRLAFSVTPSLWLRPWAIVLEVLALVGLGALFVRARERALRRRTESLAALVAERTQQLSDANVRLAELSVTDPLTGLANRRALEAHVEGEWRRLARAGGSLALVMLDVDHFKPYNDSLGHLAGDECLRRVASALRRLAQRPGDLVARYGGEEFACLFVGIEREQTAVHAERLRAVIEELALPHPASGVAPVVTISLGACWAKPEPGGEWGEVLAAADAALYRAKQGGRNRVELA